MHYKENTAFILFLTLFLLGCSASRRPGGEIQAQAGRSLDKSESNAVALQDRKVFEFNGGAIGFSNKFAAARLNDVIQVNDSTFTLLITPENQKINPSPWYAFKVWSQQERDVYLRLTYQRWRHRYQPKTSSDGITWEAISPLGYSADSAEAIFRVPVSADTALVAAQEIIDAAMSYTWMDKLARSPNIRKRTIGTSLQGRPIIALTTEESPGKKLVVVLSRQHPPEVTGYLAMQAFVERVLDQSTLANEFRKKYEVVIVPMVNPDGVENGHWRHSVGGVDLNRDWGEFKQPETAVIGSYLKQKVHEQQAKVYFGIDFHSTYHDVFYTNEDTLHTNLPGFTQRWLHALEESLPDYTINIKPSGNGSNVSKSWLMRELQAEAVTYEVGDDTDRAFLKQKGETAADRLMELLLKESR
jgi:murein tripeptide amidase MpaA